MRASLVLLMMGLLLMPGLPARAAALAEEKLPTDPALVTGTLPNGLSYIIRKHRNPEGRVSIWLHVSSGSLNETDATQGLAHYLEHMAFNGSANFPAGTVIPFFQSLGLAFGRDQNAFTSFDQTTYQLALPGGGRDVLDKGMLFMSDVAMRLSLQTAEIDSERQIILEEKRARSSAQQRVQDQIFEKLAPESALGRRLPIGIEPTIKSMMRDEFQDYYSRWYVPSNMTVMVVGDTDPAMVADVIARHFGGGLTVPRPTPRAVGIKPSTKQRAIVATDPELTRSEVSFTRLEAPRGPVTTVAERRREMVEQIGTWVFGRRLSAELATGRASYLSADASIGEWPGTMRMITVEAAGRPGTWRAMLKDIGTAFDPKNGIFIAELPASDGVPSEAEFLTLGRAALSVKPGKPADVARATTLLSALPKGGAVVESVSHAASGVTSMWLDNGVRVHHRRMDQRKNEASIEITLAGGQIQETPADRGFTEAALRARGRPATSRLTSTQIRDLMTGAKVRVRSGMGGDIVGLTVSGDPAELERGLQLAYLLLTDPVIEEPALEQWRDAELQRIVQRKTRPMQVLMDTSAAAIYPPVETRTKSLTAEQVRALTLPAAQAWLRRLITDAPVEVAVVGDIEREAATRLITRYLGALPARPRIGDKTLASLRTIARPAGAISIAESVVVLTPQAAVMSGFFGADLRDVRDTRLLNMAARILTTRMTKTIREERQLVYSIGASSDPATVYPGFGYFSAIAPTEPAKAQELAAAVEAMYADF